MRTSHTSTDSQKISGIIERITFHNPENGFCVLKVKADKQKDLITLIATTLAIEVGESVEAQGIWVNDSTHGIQFRASLLKVLAPVTLVSIEKYLASGLIKGIGPHFAKKLVDSFGEQVFHVIESEPHKLLKLGGIGQARKQQLLTSWKSQKTMRELMLFLQTHQLSSAKATRIYKAYGEKAIQKIQENPYRLAKEVYGIGFKIADTLAQKMGISIDSPLRVSAGLQHIMQTLQAEGHCAVPLHTLESHTQTLLEVPTNVIQLAIEKAIADGRFVQSKLNEVIIIALKNIYYTEQGVALQLKRLLSHKTLPWGTLNTQHITTYLDQTTKLPLSIAQRAVLIQALQAKVFIMTGGPGVGKTTIVKNLLIILQKLAKLKIALCAPTGRAAQRLAETTQWPSKTIHRLLGFEPKTFSFKHNLENPLDIDLLIIDEVSMLDITLTHQLLRAIPSHAAVLFIGDIDQLPSVGPGRVLADLIATQRTPFAKLTEVFRQAATSQIIVNAHRINRGQIPLINSSNQHNDFYFIESNSPEDIQNKIKQLVKYRIPKRFQLDPIKDIQVLTPMNRGMLGTYALNQSLQKELNLKKNKMIERFGTQFLIEDKVIQKINNYDKEVFNGDIGYVCHIDHEAQQLTVQFSEKKVDYDFSELDEINLAYAMSIHKSQGSEYPAVIIPLTLQHYRMLARNLIYTGITRGKKLVILVGEKKALSIAVHTTSHDQRITQLRERITEVIV